MSSTAPAGLTADPDGERTESAPGFAGWWLVFVLMLLYTLSYLDRQIIGLMIDPMRASLQISDFEISLLQGASFAIFFAIFGLPMGWAADRLPRRWVIFAGVVCWSLAASAGGFAQRFWQLMLSRCALGAGEAALMPAGYSLIADAFPPRRFGLAMSVFGAGAIVGGGLATMGGALLIAHVPAAGVTLPVLGHFEAWQFVFLLCGLPCLVLSPLIFTTRDPRHGKHRRQEPTPEASPAAGQHLIANARFYAGHFIGFGLFSACGFAASSWLPAFLMRHHQLSVVSTGAGMGTIQIIGGLIGILAFGATADRLFAKGMRDAHLKLAMAVLVFQTITLAAALSVASVTWCFILLAIYAPCMGFSGAAAAALHLMTPGAYRGRASAIYLFIYTLLGIGCGPSVTAFITEYVLHDDAKVGLAIIIAQVLMAPIAIAALAVAAPTMRRALAPAALA